MRMRGAVAAEFERGDGWSRRVAIGECSMAVGRVARTAGGLNALSVAVRGVVSDQGSGNVSGRGRG